MKRITQISIIGVFALTLLFSYSIAKPKKESKNAWMGVATQTVDYELAEAFDLKVKYGAIVNQVVNDSPADEAGIKEDDVIISINGDRVTDSDELSDLIRDNSPGDKVEVVLLRDDNEMTITVELGTGRNNFRFFDRDHSRGMTVDHLDPHGNFEFLFDSNNSHFTHKPHGYIGVSLLSLSDQLADHFGVREGVLISEVEEDSPAEEAGLKAGDVIVAVGEEEIDDFSDITDEIRDMKEGDKVDIKIVRDKRSQTISVEVDEQDGDNRSFGYSVTDMPKFNVKIPKMRGLHKGYAPSDDVFYFDSDEMNKEMKELKKELKELQEELRKELEELRGSRR